MQQAVSRILDEEQPRDIRKAAAQESGESTIIKDTRSRRWRLGKALGHSLSAWVGEQKEAITAITEKKEPQPKVPPVATRARVVEAARQKSALAPKDDRQAVVEKLRTLARDAERVTGKAYTLIHKPAAKEAPRWSYVEEEKQHLHTASPAPTGTPLSTARPSGIKEARKTIRPPENLPTNLPIIRLGGKPAEPVKSLVKDVAPRAEQVLPEHAFVERPKTEGASAATPAIAAATDTGEVGYGFADVAPVVGERTPMPAPEQPAAEIPEAPTSEEINEREAAIKRLLAARDRIAVQYPPETASVAPPPQEPPSRDIAFEQPKFETQKATGFRTYRDDAIRDVEENKRSIPHIAAAEASRNARRISPAPAASHVALSPRPFAIAGIVIVATIAVGGFGFFWYTRHGTLEETSAISVATFMKIDAQKSMPFSEDRDALLDALGTAAHASASGVTQIYPARAAAEGETARAVSTSAFLAVLDPRAPGSFTRNLDEGMMFGAYNATDPFFIFKTNQFDTAFAGMLAWEPYMSSDLAPLFGTPVTASRDRTLRTADQAGPARFVDDTVDGVDVRILSDRTGAERLLYAFLDKNTIIITTSREALAELIGRLR